MALEIVLITGMSGSGKSVALAIAWPLRWMCEVRLLCRKFRWN